MDEKVYKDVYVKVIGIIIVLMLMGCLFFNIMNFGNLSKSRVFELTNNFGETIINMDLPWGNVINK